MDIDKPPANNRPENTLFNQQRLKGWQLRITLNGLIAIYFLIGSIFIPVGLYLLDVASSTFDMSKTYDSASGMEIDCHISSNDEGLPCQITFNFTTDVISPLYIYYEIDNFYQNDARYVDSYSSGQLLGADLDYSQVYSECYPLVENASNLLNPCGLIANTLFNDEITLVDAVTSTGKDVAMKESNLVWPADKDVKFQMVDGFASKIVTNVNETCEEVFGPGYEGCEVYFDTLTNETYYYWYPDNDSVQYIYETFPNIISPLEGVENEHFMVWMRTAGLSSFRKLYGRIEENFNVGDSLTFEIICNFPVGYFGGSKTLVVTSLSETGTQNFAIGRSFFYSGVSAFIIGSFFALKRIIKPRPLGDLRVLGWK